MSSCESGFLSRFDYVQKNIDMATQGGPGKTCRGAGVSTINTGAIIFFVVVDFLNFFLTYMCTQQQTLREVCCFCFMQSSSYVYFPPHTPVFGMKKSKLRSTASSFATAAAALPANGVCRAGLPGMPCRVDKYCNILNAASRSVVHADERGNWWEWEMALTSSLT